MVRERSLSEDIQEKVLRLCDCERRRNKVWVASDKFIGRRQKAGNFIGGIAIKVAVLILSL